MTLVGNGIGNVTTIPFEDIAIIQNTIGFVTNPALLDDTFLYYYLRTNIERIKNFDRGSGQPSVKKTDIEKMEVAFPNIEEQKRIVSLLLPFDKEVICIKELNVSILNYLKSIFVSMFIDNPSSEEWEEGNIGSFVVNTKAGDWGKDSENGNYTKKVYCIRGADIPDVKIGNKGKMPFRYILEKNYSAKHLTVDDIVVEISGGSPTQATGRTVLITEDLLSRYGDSIVCTNFCKAIKPKPFSGFFLYFYFNYLYDKNVMFSYENGTTGIKNFDLDGFLENEIIRLPSEEMLKKFETICKPFYKQIFVNGDKSEECTILSATIAKHILSESEDWLCLLQNKIMKIQ